MTGWADVVHGPLFLRAFDVPFWVIARVFGRDLMYWCRLEVSLGHNSIVGTTVRTADLPEYQPRDGVKNYIATTVGAGCCLGAALARRPAPRTCRRPTPSSSSRRKPFSPTTGPRR